MVHSALLLLHVSGAVVGLLSGALSTLFRKGSGLHRLSGNFFAVSMVAMALSGAWIAAFIKPNDGNLMGGVLTAYVVATGWIAGRRRERQTGPCDVIALSVVLTVAAAAVTWGVEAARSPHGQKGGYPPALFFIFGSIALLFGISDLRMIARGGLAGGRRIARHLWRMCFAFLFALLSFYPSRAMLFPEWFRRTNIAYVPHVLVLGMTIYWLIRMRAKRRPAATRQPSFLEIHDADRPADAVPVAVRVTR